MPCVDAFEEQDDAYKESVLPRAVRARVSVEAASVIGWDRYVGPDGEIVGMTTFGGSGPQKALYEHFGFTPENIAEHARATVKRVSG
jgi:transketolase